MVSRTGVTSESLEVGRRAEPCTSSLLYPEAYIHLLDLTTQRFHKLPKQTDLQGSKHLNTGACKGHYSQPEYLPFRVRILMCFNI